MYIGEAFVSSGPNAAHINVFIGPKDGPVGTAMASSVAAPRMGYIPFMVVHKPNVPVKPATLFSAKADLRGDTHSNMTWGPAQAGIARAVHECTQEGVLPGEALDNWAIIAGVWVNWEAEDADLIYIHNYEAMRLAITRAMRNLPSMEEIKAANNTPENPFYTPKFE
jgi:5,6,7,8-tetrahydromethanopterin hydro-lyase